MSQQSRAITRRFFEEVFSQGRLDAIDELFVVDYLDHDPVNEQDTHGRDGVHEEIAAYAPGSRTCASPSRTSWPRATAS